MHATRLLLKTNELELRYRSSESVLIVVYTQPFIHACCGSFFLRSLTAPKLEEHPRLQSTARIRHIVACEGGAKPTNPKPLTRNPKPAIQKGRGFWV